MNGTESLSCTLVVPCHNERERLNPETFRAAERGFPWLRLLFVDDGSTDGTAELLRGFRVLRLGRRQGKAGAVRAGILEALPSSRPGDLVGFLDADLATPLADVAGLCLALAGRPGVAAAFGSRWRHLGGAIRWATRLPVHDSQCGAKVFRAEAARALFRAQFRDPWLFDVELLFRLPPGMRAEEFPLRHWEERAGSKLGLLDMALAPFGLIRLAWHYSRKPAPEAERRRCDACVDC